MWTATCKQDVDEIFSNARIAQNISGWDHVALRSDPEAAAEGAKWYTDVSTDDILLIKITFSWKVGYFVQCKPLLRPLEPDMTRWCFYGDIPFQVHCPEANGIWISVDADFNKIARATVGF